MFIIHNKNFSNLNNTHNSSIENVRRQNLYFMLKLRILKTLTNFWPYQITDQMNFCQLLTL
jgi:hypothetical protein